MTIFIGRETKTYILPRKSTKKIAKVSPSDNNYPFRIISLFNNNNNTKSDQASLGSYTSGLCGWRPRGRRGMCQVFTLVVVRRCGGPDVLRELDPRRPATCTSVFRLLHGWNSLVWTDTCAPKRVQKTTTTIIQSGEAPFQQARSLHPTLVSWSMLSPSRRPNPIPAFPPYVVRTPHLHGAPTTEETDKLWY